MEHAGIKGWKLPSALAMQSLCDWTTDKTYKQFKIEKKYYFTSEQTGRDTVAVVMETLKAYPNGKKDEAGLFLSVF